MWDAGTGLPGEAVDAPSLEVMLGRVWDNMIQ